MWRDLLASSLYDWSCRNTPIQCPFQASGKISFQLWRWLWFSLCQTCTVSDSYITMPEISRKQLFLQWGLNQTCRHITVIACIKQTNISIVWEFPSKTCCARRIIVSRRLHVTKKSIFTCILLVGAPAKHLGCYSDRTTGMNCPSQSMMVKQNFIPWVYISIKSI